MRRISLGTGILANISLTAVLAGVLYLGQQIAGLPFTPHDFFRLIARASGGLGVGAVNWLAAQLQALGLTATGAVGWAEMIVSLLIFFALALLIGLAFHVFAGRRQRPTDLIDGIVIGLVFAAPAIFAGLTSSGSTLPVMLQVAWLAAAFLAWGIGLSYAYRRLMTPAFAPGVPAGEDQPASGVVISAEDADRIGRRQFLFRLGASAAAITAVTAGVGAVLGNSKRGQAPQVQLPIGASPSLLDGQGPLLERFRRFAIVSTPGDDGQTYSILALGAEYPDRHYVSVWLGDRTPIIIYETIETALAAYNTADVRANLVWLDA